MAEELFVHFAAQIEEGVLPRQAEIAAFLSERPESSRDVSWKDIKYKLNTKIRNNKKKMVTRAEKTNRKSKKKAGKMATKAASLKRKAADMDEGKARAKARKQSGK